MSGSGGTPDHDQNFSVVPDEVRAVGRYVYSLTQTLRSALDSAGTEVDELTSSGWSGTAAAAFAEGWRESRDGGGKIVEALTVMAEKLGVTAENYQAQDTAAASRTSSLNL
ncbi:WXG100 family type VII secretion target [Nocardia sp. NPDC051463]|uniref:WXG100 family type VII secretion target n=1 Tax=Nocardia sp. NPDC051463 TaxID=3154845 RepID=UPI00343D062F